MILGVHGSKDSHTKQSSHTPTIKLTKKQNKQKTHTGFSELLLFQHPVLIRHPKKKQWPSGCYTQKKEEQSRCSEISKKSQDFSSRGLNYESGLKQYAGINL